MRDKLNAALKDAMRAKDMARLSTLRLILAALKDRDIAARTDGPDGGVGDAEAMAVLQKMVKQRRDSIDAFEKGGRTDLADKERAEIAVIEDFLPRQMSADELSVAVAAAIADSGASSIKDMGAVMALLRSRHAGVMDFGKAGPLVKAALG